MEVCPNGKEPVSKTGGVKALASSNLAASGSTKVGEPLRGVDQKQSQKRLAKTLTTWS